MKKSVLVVDLDKTLFSINTFHYYIKFLISYGLKKMKFYLVFKILIFLLLRNFKLITHAKMKYEILKNSCNKQLNIQHFVKSIDLYKNNLQILKQHFDLKILATAAPNNYSEIIAKQEMFDVCIATKLPEVFYESFENNKENKKRNVLAYLKKENINHIDVFVTDHIDDLPLIKISKKNIIVKPNENLISILNKNLINYEIVS